MKRVILAVIVPFICLTAVGCQQSLEATDIMPASVKVTNQQAGTVAVMANTGETATSRTWTASGLADGTQAISKATEDSITKYGVFAGVKPPAQADYLLEITYTDVGEPAFGRNFEATLDAHWRLLASATKKPVWEHDVSGVGRAGPGDAFWGAVRARIAEERAAAAHIQAGLEALSQAKLGPPAARPATQP